MNRWLSRLWTRHKNRLDTTLNWERIASFTSRNGDLNHEHTSQAGHPRYVGCWNAMEFQTIYSLWLPGASWPLQFAVLYPRLDDSLASGRRINKACTTLDRFQNDIIHHFLLRVTYVKVNLIVFLQILQTHLATWSVSEISIIVVTSGHINSEMPWNPRALHFSSVFDC